MTCIWSPLLDASVIGVSPTGWPEFALEPVAFVPVVPFVPPVQMPVFGSQDCLAVAPAAAALEVWPAVAPGVVPPPPEPPPAPPVAVLHSTGPCLSHDGG